MEMAKNLSLIIVAGLFIVLLYFVGKVMLYGAVVLLVIYAIAKVIKFKKACVKKWKNFRNKE